MLLFFISFFIQLSQPLFSSTSHPILSLSSVHTSVHSTFKVPIILTGNDSLSISSYQFTLEYNAGSLVLDSVSTHDTLGELGLVQFNKEIPGELHAAGAYNQPLPSTGILMELHFRTLEHPGITFLSIPTLQFDEQGIDTPLPQSAVHIESPISEISFWADTLRVPPKHSLELPIRLSGITAPIYSGSFSLYYKPEIINATGISKTHSLLESSDVLVDYVFPRPGVVNVVFASATPIHLEDLPLIHVTFESQHHIGETPIQFDSLFINEEAIPVTMQGGLVILETELIWGDVNNNALVTWMDASLILKHVLGLNLLDSQGLMAGDVSGNQAITSFDASLILQYAVGLIPCFPVEISCSAEKHKVEEDVLLSSLIYSIELKGIQKPFSTVWAEAQTHLPLDWLIEHQESNGLLELSMAGVSPIEMSTIRSLIEDWMPEEIRLNGFTTAQPDHTQEDTRSGKITKNYPNPFNLATSFQLTTPHSSQVKIVLFDILGRPIKLLIDRYLHQGTHTIKINGEDLSSGMYLVQVRAEHGLLYELPIIKR